MAFCLSFPAPAAEKIIVIPNNLKASAAIVAAIRKAAGKPTGEITGADLDKVQSLDLNNNGITDLTPLVGLTKLHTLILHHNNITDLTPLKGMKGLTHLNLEDNKITDLMPLAGLRKLRLLWLNDNLIKIDQLEPTLSGMKELTSLGFGGGNKSMDIKFLAKLKGLRGLYLGKNQITDLSPLAGMRELSEIWAEDNSITNLKPLVGLTKLHTLNLKKTISPI